MSLNVMLFKIVLVEIGLMLVLNVLLVLLMKLKNIISMKLDLILVLIVKLKIVSLKKFFKMMFIKENVIFVKKVLF